MRALLRSYCGAARVTLSPGTVRLLYRLIYNLLPFALAVLALGVRSGLKSVRRRAGPQSRSGA